MVMDLKTLADIADVIKAIVVVSGIVFGVVQIRQYQQQRRDIAAVQLVNSFQSPDFNKALRRVWSLPDHAPIAELRERGDACEESVYLVAMTFETIGVLVFRRIVPLPILDELMGDAIVVVWRKLKPWVEHLRVEQKRDSAYEWFNWLVDRLAQTERRTESGAYRRYRHWLP